MREEPHKDSPQPSGSEMAGASASVSTAPPGSGNRIPACPFLTALQIPLQPLPQPRCRNERSRISSSSCSSSPHCQSGMRLETRRMGAPSDHPAFWALPPWPMESLVTPSQLFTEVLRDQGDQ